VTTFNFFVFLVQIRGAQILDAVRLHKIGFPESVGFSEFWRRFRILSEEPDDHSDGRRPRVATPPPGEMRAAVETLLADLEMDGSAYRMGNTQVSSTS